MRSQHWLIVALCCISPILLYAQEAEGVPKAERQIVFGVAPFDGIKYLSSFLPEPRKEMRLIADADHAVTILLSDVYYWPITAEYRADFQGVHIPLAGRLAAYRGDELVREFKQTEYIYVYPQGSAGEANRLLYGEEMAQFIVDFDAAIGERAADPSKVWATHQGPFSGFVVNLPEGQYRLVFSVENQEQSFSIEKKLRVFSPLARGTVYQIIPDEKWTVSSNSETPQQRIYLKPGNIIYLKMFPTFLYGRTDYELMASPHRPSSGVGLENSSVWVHEELSLEEDPQASLSMTAGGQLALIRPDSFIVRQLEGSALGYDILNYDAEQFPGTRPTFTAYRLSAPPPGIGVTMQVPEKDDSTVRYIRTLEPRALYLSVLAFFLPVLLLLFRIGLGMTERRRIQAFGKEKP
ncbi:hypothetical protein AGMMS49546_13350 [Spirochaetia bacterium]|nr:hypothetical protein AGMMS49546_13350 [Spirochaetia bacterium]